MVGRARENKRKLQKNHEKMELKDVDFGTKNLKSIHSLFEICLFHDLVEAPLCTRVRRHSGKDPYHLFKNNPQFSMIPPLPGFLPLCSLFISFTNFYTSDLRMMIFFRVLVLASFSSSSFSFPTHSSPLSPTPVASSLQLRHR